MILYYSHLLVWVFELIFVFASLFPKLHEILTLQTYFFKVQQLTCFIFHDDTLDVDWLSCLGRCLGPVLHLLVEGRHELKQTKRNRRKLPTQPAKKSCNLSHIVCDKPFAFTLVPSALLLLLLFTSSPSSACSPPPSEPHLASVETDKQDDFRPSAPFYKARLSLHSIAIFTLHPLFMAWPRPWWAPSCCPWSPSRRSSSRPCP